MYYPKRKRDKDESIDSVKKHGKVGQWCFYLNKWWKIIEKSDWIPGDTMPALFLRRRADNKEYYMSV